jgi:hypothetical protein
VSRLHRDRIGVGDDCIHLSVVDGLADGADGGDANRMTFMRTCLLLVVACFAGFGVEQQLAPAGTSSIYAQVLQSLTATGNRQPGTPGYAVAVDGLTTALTSAGLAVDRITYPTLGLQTRNCTLSVDGHSVTGLLPLAPNGVVPATTFGGTVRGVLVQAGNGTLEELRHLPISGAIVLLRFGSPHVAQVFSLGAVAVIAVDDGTADQWQVARMFSEAPIASPRAYMTEASARAAGLLEVGKHPQGELAIDVRWVDAQATTVWAMIPAAPGASEVQARQAIVLTAEIATSGAVPDATPGLSLIHI